MSEPGSDSTPTTGVEGRHSWLDLVLAGCICAIAVSFWLWDNKPAEVLSSQQPVASTLLPAITPGFQPAPAPAPQLKASEQFNNAGTQLYTALNFVGAEALFRKAIAADPNGALGYCNLGAALIGERRYDEAIDALQKAVAIDPSFTLARNNLKWALDEKHKHKK
jgi:tetratricopeptide (TPR) repeat protein